MSYKTRQGNKNKRCSTKPGKINESQMKKRLLNLLFMGVGLFFWYVTYRNISYFFFIGYGYTYENVVIQSILAVVGSFVYTYLVLGVVAPKRTNILLSLLAIMILVFLTLGTFYLFTIPIEP